MSDIHGVPHDHLMRRMIVDRLCDFRCARCMKTSVKARENAKSPPPPDGLEIEPVIAGAVVFDE